MDMELAFNPDDLTLGDLEDFEENAGKPLMETLKASPVWEEDPETGERRRKVDPETGRPEMAVTVSAKSLRVLVWLLRRKTEPGFTMDDARNVRVSALKIGPVDTPAVEGANRGNGTSG